MDNTDDEGEDFDPDSSTPVNELRDAVEAMKEALLGAQADLQISSSNERTAREEAAEWRRDVEGQIQNLRLTVDGEMEALRAALRANHLAVHSLRASLAALLLDRRLLVEQLRSARPTCSASSRSQDSGLPTDCDHNPPPLPRVRAYLDALPNPGGSDRISDSDDSLPPQNDTRRSRNPENPTNDSDSESQELVENERLVSARELLAEEREFSASLVNLRHLASKISPLIPPKESRRLFPAELRALAEEQQSLVEELEVALRGRSPLLAEPIERCVRPSVLRLFGSYTAAFPRVLESLGRVRKKGVVEESEIGNLVFAPLHRLPRRLLGFRRVLTATPRSHLDSSSLAAATEALSGFIAGLEFPRTEERRRPAGRSLSAWAVGDEERALLGQWATSEPWLADKKKGSIRASLRRFLQPWKRYQQVQSSPPLHYLHFPSLLVSTKETPV